MEHNPYSDLPFPLQEVVPKLHDSEVYSVSELLHMLFRYTFGY